MTLEHIMSQCENLDVVEKRDFSDDYGEIVIDNKDLEQWMKVLVDALGEPIKPQGEDPSKDHEAIAEEHGGIYSNQTLFRSEFDGKAIIAMLWPWGNDANTTLKLIVVDN